MHYVNGEILSLQKTRSIHAGPLQDRKEVEPLPIYNDANQKPAVTFFFMIDVVFYRHAFAYSNTRDLTGLFGLTPKYARSRLPMLRIRQAFFS